MGWGSIVVVFTSLFRICSLWTEEAVKLYVATIFVILSLTNHLIEYEFTHHMGLRI